MHTIVYMTIHNVVRQCELCHTTHLDHLTVLEIWASVLVIICKDAHSEQEECRLWDVNVSLPRSDHCNMIQMGHITTAISMISCHLFLKQKIRVFKKNVSLSAFKVKIVSSVAIYHTSPGYIFISVYVYTAELLSWCRDPSSIICPFDTPSINSDFSETLFMAPCQIICQATYPPYLQTIFIFFSKFAIFLSNFYGFFFHYHYPVTWDPMGVKISKHYFSHKRSWIFVSPISS